MSGAPVDFVLTLHSHLPYVLNHGRWPHGSDWLCEAALDTYIPLLEMLRQLSAEETPAPVTIGFTPVLANQLASPMFAREMEAFFDQRLAACADAQAALERGLERALAPVVAFWHDRLHRLRRLFDDAGGDLVGAFRALEAAGRLEIIGSAATHGFLPLLARDESIRLQLAVGTAEHRRLFGRAPAGCWLPECAYRPRGPWAPWPTAPTSGLRRGIDEHLADAGFQFFFVDAHLASAGQPLGLSGDPAALDPEMHQPTNDGPVEPPLRSPYQAYRVGRNRDASGVSAYVRDPQASMQVWSRYAGYPGDGDYLEFHKMRSPGGLKLWRVSGPEIDLGDKQPYDPTAAHTRARGHADHFADLLGGIAGAEHHRREAVIVAPFDTELFGHWWFEGPDFLGGVYRALRDRPEVRPSTGSAHLARHAARKAIRMRTGSWGAHGDFSMWLSDTTAWTWERLWPLEERFWDVAPASLASEDTRFILAQAARELLLAQSSDWQFIISTGAAADYGERRFLGHCEDTEELVAALVDGSPAALERGHRRAAELAERDALFPDVVPAIAAALGGSRSLSLGWS